MILPGGGGGHCYTMIKEIVRLYIPGGVEVLTLCMNVQAGDDGEVPALCRSVQAGGSDEVTHYLVWECTG